MGNNGLENALENIDSALKGIEPDGGLEGWGGIPKSSHKDIAYGMYLGLLIGRGIVSAEIKNEKSVNEMEYLGKVIDVILKFNKSPHGVIETYSQTDALRDIAEIIGLKLE